ncbi:MAG: hypothetical protein CMJ78_17980 [Planctomycetaceae bacterium]|nr:hypothetical protein [Planctomycetaceae bacterium]
MAFHSKVTLILLVHFSLLVGCISHAQAEPRLSLRDGDVVTFAGGANMLHLQQDGHLEAFLTRAFADAQPKFRDWSWEADTVYRQGSVIERWRPDGFGGRDDQLKRIGGTTIIAQFGQLESLAGPQDLDRFVEAYDELIDAFQQQAKQIVLVTPTPFEKPRSDLVPDLSKRNADLAVYVEAIEKLANERKLIFVNLFDAVILRGSATPSRNIPRAESQDHNRFASSKPGLTENGMHITPESQAYVAGRIAESLGIDAQTDAKLETLRLAVIEKHRLWYDYWRPANWKLLYGDDSRRVFTRGGKDYIPFREEWGKLVPLIEKAEKRVWTIAAGGKDIGDHRPEPEKLHGAPEADIQDELASFSVPDGFQVNLFASEREGLNSPLNIRWDPAGRMYATVTTTYPHVFPGDVPNDKVISLEDTNNDGRADKSTVFVDGLNIPTGIEWGEGGVFIGQNTEILFFKDTNGDGRADQRRVLYGGFGNGDSHQTINSFAWGPGGQLYFGHGDGCESRVETPWGASNLFNAGYYRLRPRRQQLIPFLEGHMGPGNPWGVAFDAWGQIFGVDGAGGVNWLSPAQVSTTHRRRLPRIGNPGGYCGIGYLDGRHLPESMQGNFVIGDFKSNRVKRFSVSANDDGAGVSLKWLEPILQSKHRNFRPVDVKIGPDGAIYVVDWYNPITCHQDDAYRDPTRDKAHGRIWRVSVKDKPAVQPPNLAKAPIAEVVDALKAPEYWTRYQAKRELTNRPPASAAGALNDWVRSLDPKLPNYEYYLFQALGAYATIEVVEPRLLGRMLNARGPRARAFAARLVGRWHNRLDDPLKLLAPRVVDENGNVRLEAVIACSAIPSARSIETAARVTGKNSWLDYAFEQTVHRLQPHWLPAFKRGDISFDKPSQLAAVLNKAGGRDVLESLKKLVDSADLTPELQASAITAILAVGDADDLRSYGLDSRRFTRSDKYNAKAHAQTLSRLIEVARERDVRPSGKLADALRPLIEHELTSLQANAITLAGIWKVDGVTTNVLAAAKNNSLPIEVRSASFHALVAMNARNSNDLLSVYAAPAHPLSVRAAAIQSLTAIDVQAAATFAASLLSESKLKTEDAAATLAAFLNRAQGTEALSTALTSVSLKPNVAKGLLRALFSTGRSDRAIFMVLNRAIGPAAKTQEYSEDFVKDLVADASQHGQSTRGAILFKSLACSSCHKVGGVGGTIGPDLTAIGTTLSAERITEEVLWPNRQVKEGYSVIQVMTSEGKILNGYHRKTKESQESGDLVLQDIATNKLITIKQADIEQQHSAGSAMPTGLTALLSRDQLLDLISCLSSLGRIK